MNAHKISTVIITLNEEATIERCLKSVLDISDEILVLDSHSTDNTAKICAGYQQVKFIDTDWQGYSKTKNKGAEMAQHDFVLSIDADECLDGKAEEAIQHAKLNGLEGVYTLNRKNHFGNKWIKYGGWYPDVKARLYNKHASRWTGDFVHETLLSDDDSKSSHLSGDILHYTVRDRHHHFETIHKYAKLAAERDKSNNSLKTGLHSFLSAVVHFIKIYFIKLGLLHGSIGFWIAINSARSKWLRFRYGRIMPK